MIGDSPRARQKFIFQKTLEATDVCCKAYLTGDHDLHRSLVCKTRSLLTRDKEKFVSNLAEEIEGHFLVNDHRPAYQTLKKLNSKPSSQTTAIRSVRGQFISDPAGVQEYWAEYIEQLYQINSPTINLHTSSVQIPMPDPLIIEEPLTLTEGRGQSPSLRVVKQ